MPATACYFTCVFTDELVIFAKINIYPSEEIVFVAVTGGLRQSIGAAYQQRPTNL